jgi:hypothetical protein
VAGLRAGRIDVSRADGEDFFDGILGLDAFADTTLTVDPASRQIVIGDEQADGLGDLVVPVDVDRDGPAVSMFAGVSLPSGRVVRAEVDTGSRALILDRRTAWSAPPSSTATSTPSTCAANGSFSPHQLALISLLVEDVALATVSKPAELLWSMGNRPSWLSAASA